MLFAQIANVGFAAGVFLALLDVVLAFLFFAVSLKLQKKTKSLQSKNICIIQAIASLIGFLLIAFYMFFFGWLLVDVLFFAVLIMHFILIVILVKDWLIAKSL
ncbi:hypothetical protein RIF25_09475 [Thermosynechococcaceae cyanobacterium BACA0444]|uniref:Uncharacterized protein n=1 Tax=Pseudocalidococcus azoricus BACA0444 TaxID=2918990 RepID=A0AAE4FSL5_9CYAN|nr:hypothetical protein [Pseudocalidococcus azoricus]MDS3861038.1 hypothetical protein [Pseudocalidococcus azoricus BACA0444]